MINIWKLYKTHKDGTIEWRNNDKVLLVENIGNGKWEIAKGFDDWYFTNPNPIYKNKQQAINHAKKIMSGKIK